MITGRKPHPTWRRELDGNPGKRAMNHDEPQLPRTPAAWETVPVELTSPIAITQWETLAPMLYQAGQVTDGDRLGLILCCQEYARYQEASKRATTMVILTPGGFPMPNPYLTVANKAFNNCTRMLAELGLTPSSRSRVRAPAVGDEDPFAEFDRPRTRTA